MKFSIRKAVLKTLKIFGITIGSLIVLIVTLPYLFPGAINSKINQWANNNINGHINFSRTRLSFFKHFPAFTLTMYDVALKGSAPFQNDTLVAAREISLGIDLSSVFGKKITINKIFLDDAYINVQVDSAGNANYNVYKQTKKSSTPDNDTAGASLGINMILIKNSHVVYNDRSLPMLINARGFNYTGSGDLSKDVFQLYTQAEIQSLDFYYGGKPYVLSKAINANLVTEINTRSLAFVFRKNNLNINQLPVEFNGRFGFLNDGYDIDLKINSHEANLNEIVSALPAEYQKMLDRTVIGGVGNIQIELSGQYIAKDSIMPGVKMNVKVRNGYVDNEHSPAPVRDLYLDMDAQLPSLDMDSLAVNIDSLHFNIADGYFNSVFRLHGFSTPDIYARVNSVIDLAQWHRALGVRPFDVKGKYELHLLADGKYEKSVVHKGLRKTDTVITSIPKFTLTSYFRNGYFKYGSLPEAINDISFNLQASCPDNDYRHMHLSLDSLNLKALQSYVHGYFHMVNAANLDMDAKMLAKVHLDDLKKVYPADGLDLKGDLNADILAKGTYRPTHKKYPIIAGTVAMQNGFVKTKYYPHPIENIQVNTTINDRNGSMSGMNVSIQPISFVFEGEPFTLKAELHDFSNLAYKISLDGNLDVGRIYQVFAQKGYNVTGNIAAHLFLKGKQSDITRGHYDKLFNKGSLKVNNLYCNTELYPKPFIISRGVFSFKQDKMQFDTFNVKYANSVFVLNGAVSNVINYIMKPGSMLQGDFKLYSKQLVVDDFMAFASPSTSATASVKPAVSSQPAGVVLLPRNLQLSFAADVKTVKYNGIILKDVKGQMILKNDSLLLKETGFNLIGTPVEMDAAYTSLNPKKAYFSYHISAKDFDIKKAYKNIKLFHDLASSAEHAEGLISLDYQLSGNLDANMSPIYPSLKGGGVLSAKKLGMHGFRLFNAIGREARQDSLGSNSDLSKVELKTSIKNNIITLERTKMRVAGFRARIQGQASFSKELNLKFRLGLPPLGIIGIPMTVTGTEDNPKIHLGKGSDKDELQETTEED